MDELERLPGLESWKLVSVEALHPFYGRSREVVACWMTKQDRELAIAENLAYVRSVFDRVVPDGDAAGRLAVLGFSQGTAMAYRAAALAGRKVDAVIALAGEVSSSAGESMNRSTCRRCWLRTWSCWRGWASRRSCSSTLAGTNGRTPSASELSPSCGTVEDIGRGGIRAPSTRLWRPRR